MDSVTMVEFALEERLACVVDVVNGQAKIALSVGERCSHVDVSQFVGFLGRCSGNYVCLNNGMCTNSTARICTCPAGFGGPFCADRTHSFL